MILTRIGLFAPLLLLMSCSWVSGPELVSFPADVVEAHRLAGSTVIQTDAAIVSFAEDVRLRITIDTRGAVREVALDKSRPGFGDPAPAIAAARQWKFRPFEYRGHPVAATTVIGVDYRARQDWADPRAGFPAIDYATLRIELSRWACQGACPIYTVSIAGDGTVTYGIPDFPKPLPGEVQTPLNIFHVLLGGPRHARIDRAALDALIRKFRDARFFGLKQEYQAQISDAPMYVLRFTTGGRTFEVKDYEGRMVGMPDVAAALEDEVDRVAGTARWIRGDATTVPALRAQGFDPHGSAAVELARDALESGGEVVVLDLIAAGTPLDRMVKVQRNGLAFPLDRAAKPTDTPTMRPLGLVLLADALRTGRTKVARALVERGWLAKMPAAERSAVFAEGAGGCDPVLIRALIAAGADPNARTPAYDWSSSSGHTALYSVRYSYRACPEVEDRIAAVTALLDAGTNPNLGDASGATPLFDLQDPAMLDLLLARGARADVKDKQGNSPAFGAYSDLIALRLLEAGADPNGKNVEGKTLRMLAKERAMPATAAWLDRHGIR